MSRIFTLDELGLSADEAIERLMRHTNKTDGCWDWIGGKRKDGYGIVIINYGHHRAHRVSYLAHKGSLAPGLVVCHSCDRPACINPDHLFAGTQRDNLHDMKTKQRHARGDTCGRRKLDSDQVRQIRADTRLQREIAATYGVDQSLISLIKSNKQWSHL